MNDQVHDIDQFGRRYDGEVRTVAVELRTPEDIAGDIFDLYASDVYPAGALSYVMVQDEKGFVDAISHAIREAEARAAERIAKLERALWLLAGDVEALHRTVIPFPGEPPFTDNEKRNLATAKELLAGYEGEE